MVWRLIAFSIFSLVEFALEYKFVLLIDFPIRYNNGKSIARAAVVMRCIAGVYAVISIVLAVLIYVFLGYWAFIFCIFVEIYMHLMFHLAIAVLRRKYIKWNYSHRKSKWL